MSENQAQSRKPSRFRFALLVFLGVYPLVTVLQLIILPLTEGWPLLLRNLVFVPVMVMCMVWGLIPFIQTRLRHLL
jgi:antibiotic biosynthesis monooxygenase (ABM) superfamily enzyme